MFFNIILSQKLIREEKSKLKKKLIKFLWYFLNVVIFVLLPFLLKLKNSHEDYYWYLLILIGMFIPIENIISFFLKTEMYGSISISFTKTPINDGNRKSIFIISILIYIGFLLFIYLPFFFLNIRK